MPTWSGNKIELDGTNYFYVENADELVLGNTNSKKYHFFIVYKSTGQIDPSYGSTMLFGNYETNYTTGTKRNGVYPNMFYGINVYDENNSYASTPGNGFIRFGGRDDEGDFQGVWEPTVIEADNQFHIISAGESNANNKMYVVLDGNIQSITRNLSVTSQVIMVKGSLLEVEVMGLMQKDGNTGSNLFSMSIKGQEAQIAGINDIYQKNGVLPVRSIVMETASWMQRMQLQQA